jgi:hypothetical protein
MCGNVSSVFWGGGGGDGRARKHACQQSMEYVGGLGCLRKYATSPGDVSHACGGGDDVGLGGGGRGLEGGEGDGEVRGGGSLRLICSM